MPDSLCVSWLFFRIDVPDDVVWQPNDLVTSTLSHLSETFRLGLVLKSVAWEVDA